MNEDKCKVVVKSLDSKYQVNNLLNKSVNNCSTIKSIIGSLKLQKNKINVR